MLTLSVLAIILAFALTSCDECLHPVCSEWKETKAASCTETGTRERTCRDCGEVFSETIKKKSHSYGDYKNDMNETCTFIGSSTAKCKNCDATVKKKNDGNPYGHTYFDGVCSECGDTMTLVESFNVPATVGDTVKVNVYKSIDGHYELDVTGNGAMRDFTEADGAPWKKYASNITTIHFYEGVTRIGNRAFIDLAGVSYLLVEKGLKSFGENVFKDGFSPAITHVFDIATWISFEFDEDTVPPIYTTTLIYVGDVTVGNDGKKRVENKSTTIGDLKIPDGITKINAYAFYGCAHMTTVEIPASVTEIGDNAFYGCTRLDEVHISDLAAWCKISFGDGSSSPLRVGKRLWLSGELVERLVIPDSISSISEGAFEGCTSILTLTFGTGIKNIPAYAFYNCTSLQEITIPEGVESIGEWAFYSNSSLKSVSIPDSVTAIGSDAFRDCKRLSSVNVGDGVASIGNSVFSGCLELMHVEIGEKVTSIDESAFANCYKIAEIYNRSPLDLENSQLGRGAISIYTEEQESKIHEITDKEEGNGLVVYDDGSVRYILGYVGKSTSLTISSDIVGGAYGIYERAFYNSPIKKLTVEDGVISFGKDAFLGTALTYVRIRNIEAWCGVSFDSETSNPLYYTTDIYIGDEAAAVTSIKIPDAVTAISAYAFAGLGHLSSISLPDGLVEIGRGAFLDCTKAIKISSGVSYIGKWVVGIDKTKPSVIFLADTAGFAAGVFDDTTYTAVTLPAALLEIIPTDNVKSITVNSGDVGEAAFAKFGALESVTLSSSVKNVSDTAFSGCVATAVSVAKDHLAKLPADKITSLTIVSGSIKAADVSAFTALKSLTLTSGVTSLEASAFKGFTSLESVSIKGGLTTVPQSAFEGCSSLKSVSLHSGISSIGEGAFEGTASLTEADGVYYVDKWVVDVDDGAEEIVIGADTVGLADGVFASGTSVKTVYYLRLIANWNAIKKNSGKNDALSSIKVYFYREIKPYQAGSFWRYVDGVPTPWVAPV